jgi:hypothetical protein
VTTLIHIGDLHLAPGPRQAQRYAALDQIITEGASLPRLGGWLFPGDLSDARQSIEDKNGLADRFVAMANRAPLVITYGNHDLKGDLDVFRALKAEWPIYVIDRPRVIQIELATGEEAAIFVLPYPTKAGLVSLGLVPADVHDVGGAALLDICRQASHELTEARKQGLLTLMIGHVNVAGSIASTGQPQVGHEIEISAEHLDLFGDIYKGLNHIHKGQEIHGAWYAGSVCRLSWGEIEPKRYLQIDVGEQEQFGNLYWVRFLAGAVDDPTPDGRPHFEWWFLGDRVDGRCEIHALIEGSHEDGAWSDARRYWPEATKLAADEKPTNWRPDRDLFTPSRTPYTVIERPINVPPMFHVDGDLTRDDLGQTVFNYAYPDGLDGFTQVARDWTGCEVRVRYTYKQSEKAALDHTLVRQPFATALRLDVEPMAVPDRALRAPAVAEAKTLADKVRAWGETVGLPTTDALLDKLAKLEHADAAHLIITMQQELAALTAEEESVSV